MDVEALLAGIGAPVVLALLAPLLGPLYRLLDKSRRRQELRHNLEDIKLLLELNKEFPDSEPFFSKEHITESLRKVSTSTEQSKILTGIGLESDVVPTNNKSVTKLDIFVAFAIPVVLSLIHI